jgi:predicted AAA+ superfamily ATPase
LLRPHATNFNKRVTKTPKIYFYDTGLACSLLEIQSPKSLSLNPFYGHLFENLLITDLYKQYYNIGLPAPLYFWRDKNGELEIDCLINYDSTLIPIEIKSGETFNPSFFNTLTRWHKLTQTPLRYTYVIYGGSQAFEGEQGNLVPWYEAGTLIKKIKADS